MDIVGKLLWFTAVSIVVTLFFNFRSLLSPPGRRDNRKTFEKKLPPEADGGWPVIGHLRLLSGPDLPHITLSNMADKYGPVFTLRLGVHRALIVSSWEAAKECFTTNDIIFSDRPKTAAIQHMGYNFAMFGFSPYGSYWRELRRISTVHLLSTNKVNMLRNSFEFEVRTLTRKLYESSCVEKVVPLEMNNYFKDMTLNLMLRIVLGERGNGKGIEVGETEKLREGIEDFFRMMEVLTIPDVIPFSKWLDCFGKTNERFKKTGKDLDSLLQVWLEDHKESCDSERNDGFMAEMMVEAKKVAAEFPQYDADTIIKATCQTVMLGGTDTMTVTLTWALSLLLNNRHTIERAQHELDIHVGRERQVKASDIANLAYIQSIIKETLRLYPPATLLPPRESTDDCTVAGHHIPDGTRLIINMWKLHRDPRVWADPLEFQPERFLTSPYKEFDVRGQHFEFLPFGGGRRICPGISFALQLTTLALASLMHGFYVDTVLTEAVDMTGSSGATNVKATPLEVLLTPRLSPHVYA